MISTVLAILMGLATTIQQQVAAGQDLAAYQTFDDLCTLINKESGGVDLADFMLDNTMSEEGAPGPNKTSSVMNGFMMQKYKIIPKNVTWKLSSDAFDALKPNFMKPAISVVDEILKIDWNVTVFSGQLDVVASTMGAESWVRKLRWDGLQNFLGLPRYGLTYCPPYSQMNAFVRSYKNFNFYWVLGAGHIVVDQPCTALHMIGDIVQSPAA